MNETNHPTPSNIRMVAKKLERMIPETRQGNINMRECDIYKEPDTCGTIACHGGFYAVQHALENKDNYDFIPCNANEKSVSYLHKKAIRYFADPIEWEDGAERMAHDLGFGCREELQIWASTHPDLWGNESGHHMFISESAFNEESSLIKLENIVKWWRQVAARIEKINRTQ